MNLIWKVRFNSFSLHSFFDRFNKIQKKKKKKKKKKTFFFTTVKSRIRALRSQAEDEALVLRRELDIQIMRYPTRVRQLTVREFERDFAGNVLLASARKVDPTPSYSVLATPRGAVQSVAATPLSVRSQQKRRELTAAVAAKRTVPAAIASRCSDCCRHFQRIDHRRRHHQGQRTRTDSLVAGTAQRTDGHAPKSNWQQMKQQLFLQHGENFNGFNERQNTAKDERDSHPSPTRSTSSSDALRPR
jgi:hypothetical protein